MRAVQTSGPPYTTAHVVERKFMISLFLSHFTSIQEYHCLRCNNQIWEAVVFVRRGRRR